MSEQSRIDVAYLNRLFTPIDWANAAQRREFFGYTAKAVRSNASALLVQDQSEGTKRWFVPYGFHHSERHSLEGLQLDPSEALARLDGPRVCGGRIKEIPGPVYRPLAKAGFKDIVVVPVQSSRRAPSRLVIANSPERRQDDPYDLKYDACARNMIHMIAGMLSLNGLGCLRNAELPGLSQTRYLVEREELLRHNAGEYAAYSRGRRLAVRPSRDAVLAELARRNGSSRSYVVKVGHEKGVWVAPRKCDAADADASKVSETARELRRKKRLKGLTVTEEAELVRLHAILDQPTEDELTQLRVDEKRDHDRFQALLGEFQGVLDELRGKANGKE